MHGKQNVKIGIDGYQYKIVNLKTKGINKFIVVQDGYQ